MDENKGTGNVECNKEFDFPIECAKEPWFNSLLSGSVMIIGFGSNKAKTCFCYSAIYTFDKKITEEVFRQVINQSSNYTLVTIGSEKQKEVTYIDVSICTPRSFNIHSGESNTIAVVRCVQQSLLENYCFVLSSKILEKKLGCNVKVQLAADQSLGGILEEANKTF